MIPALALLAASTAFDGVIGLSQNGKTLNLSASGWADAEGKKPLKVKDQFPICSISKLFTSVLVMGFVEEGRLSLNDSAGKFLTWLPEDAKSVTIKQLLYHSSGLPNMDDASPKGPDGVSTFYFKSSNELISLRNRILTILNPGQYRTAGAEFSYNNLDFLMLEAIVEAVSEEKFSQVIADRLLKPLGMKNTKPISWRQPDRNLIVSFDRTPETRFNFALYGAAGGWSSNAEDLMLFGNGLLTGKIKGSKTLLASEPQFGFVGPGSFVYSVSIKGKNLRAFDRGGEIANFCHDLMIIPEAKAVLVVLSPAQRSRFQLAYTGSGLPLEVLQRLSMNQG